MGSVRMLDCGSLQGPSVDLLLIVFFVTIIGKRMCLPIGTATVGALLQGPGSCEVWSFDAAALLEGGLWSMEGTSTYSCVVSAPLLLGGRVLTRSSLAPRLAGSKSFMLPGLAWESGKCHGDEAWPAGGQTARLRPLSPGG